MKAAEVAFQELLNGNIQYRVPLFQRTYSWTEENWQRLWDDVLDVYALKPPRSHFLGAVVTLPLPDAPERAGKYLLIDGQQRFTTLFILLATLRDAAHRQGQTAMATQIQEECLVNRFARADEHEKVRPTQKDVAAFQAVIAGNGGPATGTVGMARQYFESALAIGDLDGAPIDLERLRVCVTAYLSLVSIKLEQHDSPHRIFESLNNTGMSLSASDLVRNHIFMRISTEFEQQHAYDTYWFPMQQRLEAGTKSELSDFFWRYLMMRGELPRSDEVYEAMRVLIDEETKTRTVVQVLGDLNRFSEFYARIAHPEQHETSLAIRTHLMRLNQWEVDVAYPFLLNALDKHAQGVIGESDLLRVLRAVESYVVRRFICNVPTNQLRRIFARMAGSVNERKYVESCYGYLMANNWPSDTEFREAFQTARIYVASRLARTRLILSSLEESFQHHERVELTTTITLEHVMPQALSAQWQRELGPDAAAVHEKYLHTGGNLTYSGYNQEMGNEPFARKKPILQQSHFELNRAIVKCDQWTGTEIQRRAQALADRAVTIWKRGG